MITQIDYRIQTSSLPWGGSYDNPLGIAHPNMQVYHDHLPSGGIVSGDQAVIVPKGERIIITCTDASGRRNVQMAPVRFLAGTWNRELCTPAMLTNTKTKPLDVPQFDESHSAFFSFSYKPGTPGWTTDSAPFTPNMGNSAMIGNDVVTEENARIGPYISFAMQDLPGSLWYGLSFAVVMDNVRRGFFWFDPTISVQ